MNRPWLLLLLCFVIIGATACAGEIKLLDETKLKDLSLISGEPCEAPCWQGIVPGETNFRDAKLRIEEDERYHNVQEAERQEDSDARVLGFSAPDAEVCCQLFSRDGETVSSLLLQLAPDISLGAVMNRYGEPRYLGGEAPAADQAYLALVFDQTPMVVYAFVAGQENGKLSTDSPLIGVMLLARAEMDLLLNCSRLYAWDGFASFKSTIDENYDYVGADVDNEEVCGAA